MESNATDRRRRIPARCKSLSAMFIQRLLPSKASAIMKRPGANPATRGKSRPLSSSSESTQNSVSQDLAKNSHSAQPVDLREDTTSVDYSRTEVSPYDAVPLPLDDTHKIRLLRILPKLAGNTNDMISCELRLASLHERYVALSYRWGDQPATELIRLNGQLFPLRRNLWEFLRQKREEDDAGASEFWIDALCIKQESNSERSHQVDMMGQIYLSATKVLIWLGPAKQSYSAAMSRIESVFDPRQPAEWFIDGDWEIAQMGAPFCDPYWTRAWIVQECVLAAELELQCGSDRLPSAKLCQIGVLPIKTKEWNDHRRTFLINVHNHLNSTPAMKVLQARNTIAGALHPSYRCIRPWEHTWPILACSDPKDRIYSLLGLMRDASRGRLVPDYDISAVELFLRVVDVYGLDDVWTLNNLGKQLELTEGPPELWPSEVKRAFIRLGGTSGFMFCGLS